MTDFTIIGGGISGLLCATLLQRGGASVTVLDKGRGFGGRLATRRSSNGRIDHGAQFITVRDPRFRVWIEEWLEAGVVGEWFRGREGGQPRYTGRGGQSAIGKHLGSALDVRRETRAVSLVRTAGTWVVQTAGGAVYSSRSLVLAMPMPQLLPLLGSSGYRLAPTDDRRFRAVRYHRSIAALLELDGPAAVPEPGGLKIEGSPHLAWIADNQQKGISPDQPTVTLHSTPEFAETYWDRPDAERVPLLIDAARPWLGATVTASSGHRWGFSRPVVTAGSPWFYDPAWNLAMAGDSFGGDRVEGAALSGIGLAGNLLSNSAAGAA